MSELLRRREEIEHAERPRSWSLWLGTLLAPAAWSIQILVNYNMEESFLCAPGIGEADKGELYGLSVDWWITSFNVVLILMTVAGGLFAYGCWRRLRHEDMTVATARRAHWMAVAGMMVSVTFFFIVGIGFAPALILDSCQNSL